MFKEVPTRVDFPQLEHRILDFWKESNAFRKLWERNKDQPKFSFIDGPITANNPMGVHHAWGRTYKDLFQRYQAMKGHELRYQNGFDGQGLWIEVEVERELGFESKRDIEKHGLAGFVERCKERVLRFAAIQTEQSIRLGYWMDWDDPGFLRDLAAKMAGDSQQVITVQGTDGPVTDTVEMIVGRLGSPELGGSYFTLSNENNYTIWTALKKCHERGWIYKGNDVMPWCPRCSTALSEHEIVTEGYRELTHPGLTVTFPLPERRGESLLVWTTTPWTLTSNVATAVHPDLTYVKVRNGDKVLYLSQGALPILEGDYQVLAELPGREMEGWAYDGPFDELPIQQEHGGPDAHRVILWDEVSEVEGSGIVHIAPGCGKEDLELGKEHALPGIAPLDEFGVFVEGLGFLGGTHVYDSSEPIFEDLRRKGLLYKVEDYTHRYPVCWRCQNELVFRLVDEWFIFMGKQFDKPLEEVTPQEKDANLRYQIMDITNEIDWIPEFGRKRELDWLRNMHDWMISKKRYSGLALPIWECHECGAFDVIGSRDELKERAVEGWDELEGHAPHRPYVDAVKIACSDCGATISRIPEVGNPWLDAGIVAFSTLRYNTDREYWANWYPADWISESFPGQFRNWFYSLLALSTIMERKRPFDSVFSYALLLAEDGREMHKSWGNAIWFDDAAEQMGVDVMRWMFCAHKPENNLLFGYHGADEVRRRFHIPLWNVYSFFVTYANLDGWRPARLELWRSGVQPPELATLQPLDKWILSRLQWLVETLADNLDNYDACTVTRHFEAFVDDLSNWYVRRSRRRFWKSEADADKDAAYTTLYVCLTTMVRLLAPFIPFVAEEMYQNLVRSVDQNAPESVHHTDWLAPNTALLDEELMADMGLAIRVSSLGRSARSTSGVKLRQPLARAVVVAGRAERERLERLSDLVVDELNVKVLDFAEKAADLVEYEIGLLPSVLGKKYGPLFPRLRMAVADLDAEGLAMAFRGGLSVDVDVDGQTITLLPEEVEVRFRPRAGYAVSEERGLVVGVDVAITPDLEAEGLARDLVRRIQNARKEAGFDIADRIATIYQTGPKLAAVFAKYADYIAAETLSLSLVEGEPPGEAHVEDLKLAGESLKLGLLRQ
ncbi:MAG: isoleucine--tRNA ligase [Anaerolineae bacterium]|nr:MAG: isoleucine--tRNA ligase [Anaerolineae bacterium]